MPSSRPRGDSTPTAGFPHSDICGSSVTCTSPQLFAAYRVLRRLIWPRHPPYALSYLTCLFEFLRLDLSFLEILLLTFSCSCQGTGLYRNPQISDIKIGGDEEDRTPDPLLARQVLSQLSYTPTYHLTSALNERTVKVIVKGASVVRTTYEKLRVYRLAMVGLGGLEPPTSRLSGVRSNQLSYRPI